MKYAYVALAGAVLAGDAAAFAPASMPSVRGPASVRMVAAAPAAAAGFSITDMIKVPWKNTGAASSSGAEAYHARHWTEAGKKELPASTYEPRPYDGVAAGHVQAPAVVRATMAAMGGASAPDNAGAAAYHARHWTEAASAMERNAGAAAYHSRHWTEAGKEGASLSGTAAAPKAGTGTQAAPPAKLQLPKAKLEAAAVNQKQWINPAPAAKASAPAPVDKQGTQAAPPAKLQLPKAKLEAAAVNQKQWINPAPAPAPAASEKSRPLLDDRSTTVSGDLAAAIKKLKGDYEAASAAGAAALPKAIDAQNAMTTTVNSYGDKLKALAAMSTSRLGTSKVPSGPNDLSKFREEQLSQLKKAIAKWTEYESMG